MRSELVSAKQKTLRGKRGRCRSHLLSCRPKCNERGSTPLLQRATVSPTQSDITLREL
jgi:hypothetical protein